MVKKINFSYIYFLIDPETKEIKYVGQCSDMATRLNQHLTSNSNSLKDEWIKKLKFNDMLPIMQQVEFLPSHFASAREAFHITDQIAKGSILFNIHSRHKFKSSMYHFELRLDLRGLLRMDSRNSEYFESLLLNHIIAKYYEDKLGYVDGNDINEYVNVKTFDNNI